MRVETGDGWELRCGDCLDPETGLASLESVDHVITDPPFNQQTSDGARTGAFGSKMAATRYVMFDGVDGQEATLAAAFLRPTRRWAVVFCAFEQLGAYKAGAQAYRWVRSGVWRKPNAMPQRSGDRPSMCGEAIALMHAVGAMRWNGRGKPLYYEANTCGGIERVEHPTQKPRTLMETLVRDFTDPDDLICDPFAGSATTGVACIRLGRRFIGWERDEKFFEVAVKRLRATRPQGDLFERPQVKSKQGTLDL